MCARRAIMPVGLFYLNSLERHFQVKGCQISFIISDTPCRWMYRSIKNVMILLSSNQIMLKLVYAYSIGIITYLPKVFRHLISIPKLCQHLKIQLQFGITTVGCSETCWMSERDACLGLHYLPRCHCPNT